MSLVGKEWRRREEPTSILTTDVQESAVGVIVGKMVTELTPTFNYLVSWNGVGGVFSHR